MEPPSLGAANYTPYQGAMKMTVFAALFALGSAAAAAQNPPAEPKNFSIDPWHINVPKPVADPVTSVTEKIPGSDLSAEIIYVEITGAGRPSSS
jgi:hypothetical protein